MKNWIFAAVAAIMLALAPMAYADEACENGAPSMSETIANMDAMGIPHVVMTGEALEAFTTSIENDTGIAKPEWLDGIVGPARGQADGSFLTFEANGCLHGIATMGEQDYLNGLTAAFGDPS